MSLAPSEQLMIYPGTAPASSPDLGPSSVSASAASTHSGSVAPQGMMLAEGLGLASLGGQAAAYSAHNGHNLEKSVRIWKFIQKGSPIINTLSH